MSRGRSWWRAGAGVAAWVVIAVATAALAWAAVDVVTREGDEPTTLTVPSGALVDRSTGPSTSTGTPSSGEQPPTGGTTSGTDDSTTQTDDAPLAQQSLLIPTRGGQVSAACTDSGAIELRFATPANGWQDESDADEFDATDDEVEVTFVRGDDEEIRIRARCQDGLVEFDLSD